MAEKKTNEQFHEQAIGKVHENLSLERFVYVNAKTKGITYCRVHLIEHPMLPNKVLLGQGCPFCKLDFLSNKFRLSFEEVIRRFLKAHGNLYDYSLVEYKSNSIPVKIICKKHGIFLQAPEKHWQGGGCEKCRRLSYIPWNRRSLQDFIDISNFLHEGRYLYHLIEEYLGGNQNVKVFCPKINHGVFLVTVSNHIHKLSGCPKCSNKISLAENQLMQLLIERGADVIKGTRRLGKYDIDIYSESKKIGIEYNGLYYHSETMGTPRNYHLDKYNLAKEKGITLIQIFEDEYLLNKDLVIESLLYRLGLSEMVRIPARKTIVKPVSPSVANDFYSRTNIQGPTSKSIVSLGLYRGEELLACISFSPSIISETEIDLRRYSSLSVSGGFSKLLINSMPALKAKGFTSIITFSDNRWSDGQLYRNSRFTQVGHSAPDYCWTRRGIRYHKREFQRKYLETRLKIFDPELSESQNCLANGYHKIWDAGKTKWSREI